MRPGRRPSIAAAVADTVAAVAAADAAAAAVVMVVAAADAPVVAVAAAADTNRYCPNAVFFRQPGFKIRWLCAAAISQ